MKMTMVEAGRLGWNKSQASRELIKQQRIDSYYKSPATCFYCQATISYENYVARKQNERQVEKIFCNRSCAASHNNKTSPKRQNLNPKFCLGCQKKVVQAEYCRQCKPSADYLALVDGRHNFSSDKIRKILIWKNSAVCMLKDCGWDWTKPSGVEVDHINGNSTDNRIENLRLICPNCHTQTPTYKAKNIGNGRHIRRQRYKDGKSY